MFENNVHLLGRLTADPELKTTGNGIVVCNFTVAVNRPVAKGEHPEADFVRCVAWKQSAELLEKYFNKGDRVGVEGRIQVRNYETTSGEKRNATEVVVDRISFIEKKGESTAKVTHESTPANAVPPASFSDDDDELPI